MSPPERTSSAEDADQSGEPRFRALTEQSPDVTLLLDESGTITYISPSVTSLMGYRPEELVGSTAFLLAHPDDSHILQAILSDILAAPGKTRRAEYRLRCKDGSYRWFEGSGTNLLQIAGVEAIVGNFRDSEERHRISEFINLASHELKTPVTSLKGFIHLLRRRLPKDIDSQTSHFLDRMNAQLVKLTRLIEALLDLSRLQAGPLIYQEEVINLDELVHEIVGQMRETATTHTIQLVGQTSTTVMGDRERLGQVFFNLLANAVKYSFGASLVTVTLAMRAEDALISVRDYGIGIAPVHHKRVFERFYQVSNPLERTFPGLGIGLYLSSQIVERHQGYLWVESDVGQGATFFVRLPVSGQAHPAHQ